MLDVDVLIRGVLARLAPGALFEARLRFEGRTIVCDAERFRCAGPVAIAGLGKAAVPQVLALRELLERHGVDLASRPPLAITKRGHAGDVDGVEVLEAAHPVCDATSLTAGDALIGFVRALHPEESLVLCLSGGGSALAVRPRPPFDLETKVRAVEQLLRAGASIAETNLVRREMSALKNGGLLRYARGPVLTLVTSDVPSDDLGLVASGPTLHRPIDAEDVRRIVEERLSNTVHDTLLAELSRPERERWHAASAAAAKRARALAFRIADHATLARAAAAEIERQGLPVIVVPEPFDVSLDEGLPEHVRLAAELARGVAPRALVTTGEMPVRVTGPGRGGRCTEFVCRLARALFVERRGDLAPAQREALRVLAIATDGSDGPTDHTGGWLTAAKLREAERRGLALDAALDANDTLPFLEHLGCAIRTGPTATNLMDLRVLELARPTAR